MTARSPVHMRVWFLIWAVLCATTATPAAETTRPPETFSLHINHWGRSSSHIEIHPVAAELQLRTSRHGRLLTHRTIKIPAERWTLFQRRLKEARVWQWQNRYDNFGITDGTNWRLDLAWAGQEVSSAGQNAYPENDGFRTVIAAIVELQHGIPVFPRAIR